VRVAANDAAVIGKSLDAGAIGVIVPMVNTVAQARAAVAACRFPPLGDRSYGAGRLGLVTPGFSPAVANELVACFVMVETVEAVENIDEIVAVPGVDGVFVGPVDLAISAGMPATVDNTDPAFVGWLETVVAACERAGVVPGIFGGPAAVVRRFRDLGFRLIATAPDTALVQGGARALLAAVKAPGDSQ
jgi:4-hydroxy-2-oxoheptanedioate aldolase